MKALQNTPPLLPQRHKRAQGCLRRTGKLGILRYREALEKRERGGPVSGQYTHRPDDRTADQRVP